VLGQIYFTTNGTTLGADDAGALDRLVAAFNEFRDKFRFDPIHIEFVGSADPRETTFPGGNRALSDDRASACLDYFLSHLTSESRLSVVATSGGVGVDRRRLKALDRVRLRRDLILKRMRVTEITRPNDPPIPRLKKAKPPKDCDEARERGRTVLRTFAGMFTSDEARHLAHICDSATARDAFLNGSDRELQRLAASVGGTMTDADAEAFANRFHACSTSELMNPLSTGPDADDLSVVGALKDLHSRIDQGIDVLVINAAQEGVTGIVNQRRVKLMEFVVRETKNPRSIYFNWLSPP
jgi:hypothetical protein